MINVEQIDQTFKISYFDVDGNIDFVYIPIPESEMYEWVIADNKKPDSYFKSWDNKPVAKRKTQFLSKMRTEEFLLNQPDEIKNKIWAYNTPKKFFIDIEVINDDEWPNPTVARHEITTLSFAHNDIIVVMGTKPLSSGDVKHIEKRINDHLDSKNYPHVKFSYIKYETEYDMLYTFMNKWIQKMPLISGWNVIKFDWAYLINRCRKLAIDPANSSVSKKLSGRDETPYHRVIVDYLDIYKKWDRVIFKENNTLNYVAEAATGLKKISYNGTLVDLYESDFSTYVFYNAIDSILVRLIDEKISTMDTFLGLAKITKSEYLRVFSPISITETAICHEFYKRGKVFPNLGKRNLHKNEYEGAYVFVPEKGMKEWVASFDFASLYPSIMRQWNMSPESYIGKVDKTDKLSRPENSIISSSGAMFKKEEESVFKTVLTHFFSLRKDAKKQMNAVDMEIEKLKELKESIKKI
jgi:DNA polymerase elongation subunit (family B)